MQSQDTPSPRNGAAFYLGGGFCLVPIPVRQKNPKIDGWQAQQFQASDFLYPNSNMGLNHALSGTAALDLDHPLAETVLKDFGIDLQALYAINPYQVRGNPARSPKTFWRVPEGITLPTHKLNWPDPAKPDNPKARVCIFELRAVGGQDVLPPSLHPGGFTYEWTGNPPAAVADLPELPDELVELWLWWDEFLPVMQAACPWAENAPQAKPERNNRSSGKPRVIDEFNQRHDVTALLEKHGYTRKGKKYVAPGSSTGQAGVSVFSHNRIYSHHGSDALGDGKRHDAFDCFKILEHGGDEKAAIKAAARLMGMDSQATRQPAQPAAESSQPEAAQAAADIGEPLPLQSSLPPGQAYPVDALGTRLAAAVRAVARQHQLAEGLVAQSFLGAVSLAAQGLAVADVRGLHTTPGGLYVFTIANSGEGKDTADSQALKPAHEAQKEWTDQYRKDFKEWQATQDAENREEPPRNPVFLVRDPTWPFISKRLTEGLPFAGLFTNEGAQFFGGFSMAKDNQGNTIGGFSDLWSNGTVTRERVRNETGAFTAYQRSLTVHIQMQPKLAEKMFFSQAQFLDQGFAARFLIHMPPSTQGKRKINPDAERADLSAMLFSYQTRLREMLELSKEKINPDTGELSRSKVILSQDAWRLYAGFHNRLQDAVLPYGEFHELAPIAMRGAEQAVRIALCLHCFENEWRATLDADTMQRGITLAEFYLSEAARLFGNGERDNDLDKAEKLAVWFRDRWLAGEIKASADKSAADRNTLKTVDIVRHAKRMVDGQTRIARHILGVLAEHRWVFLKGVDTWDISPCRRFPGVNVCTPSIPSISSIRKENQQVKMSTECLLASTERLLDSSIDASHSQVEAGSRQSVDSSRHSVDKLSDCIYSGIDGIDGIDALQTSAGKNLPSTVDHAGATEGVL